jgi:PST family polysaccharide transporter
MSNAETAITPIVKRKSYGDVLKSSALVGGSSIIEIAVRIARTKAMALMLGPSGIGLLGVYTTIGAVVGNLAGMGIKTSGVRQIAEAVGSGDDARIGRTAITLQRVAFVSGLLGAVLLLAASRLVSRVTFGDETRAGAVALMALTILLGDIADAQAALVQGMRRISDLAHMSVLGAVYGTAFSIPIVYLFGERGLVPSLVCVAAMSAVTSWWYARRVRIPPVQMSVMDTVAESSGLLKLGLVFMFSGLLWMSSAYLVRLIILRGLGIEAAGFFQAAWVIGGLYTGLVLRAMAADFYPRLVAVAENNDECNRLTNEQAEMVLLMACPGVLATLTFAPIVIELFYSAKFGPSVSILRWICLGMLLQVAAWSMGYIVVAKGKRRIFFWSELLSNAVLLGLVWASVKAFGLTGAGIGFFGMYLAYAVGIYLVVRRLTGFRASEANQELVLLFSPVVAVVFIAPYILPSGAATILGLAITMVAGVYSFTKIYILVPQDRLPSIVRKLLSPLLVQQTDLVPEPNHAQRVPEETGVLWQGDGLATKLLLAYCRKTVAFRGKGRLFQFLAAHAFGGSLTVRNHHGVRLKIDPADYIGRTIAFEGGFEPKSIALSQSIMRGGGVFLDVGCNFGLYTLCVGSLPGVRCIAIDGSFMALAQLKENLETNPGIDARLVSCALGIGTGLQRFEVAFAGNLGSTRMGDNDIEAKADPSQFWAASIPLQSVLERLCPDRIKLMKIDVEGSEMSVLRGLDFEGPYRPRNLVVECYGDLFPQAHEAFDFLVGNGYVPMTIEGERMPEFRKTLEENVWFRCARESES